MAEGRVRRPDTRRSITRRDAFARAAAGAAGVGVLAACGPVRPGAPPAPGARPPANIRHLARGNDAYFKLQRELRDLFQARYPTITVEVDESPGDWYQKFVTQSASGTPPDTVFECDCRLGASVRNSLVEQLDPWLAKEKRFKPDAWHEVTWYASTYRGKRWGLPWDGGSLVLYYNRDLFQAANVKEPDPKKALTWDELVTLAQRLTLDAGGRRAGESGFDPTRVTQYGLDPNRGVWQLYVFGAGGEVIEKDGKVPIDSPQALGGLRFLEELLNKHAVAPSPKFVTPTPIRWQDGNLAMAYNGVWNLAGYRQQLTFNWEAAPSPVGKARATLGWWSMMAMTPSSKQKEAAWEWIFWTVSEEGLKHAVTTGVSMPPLKSLRSAFVQPDQPPKNQEVFYDELDPKALRAPGDRYGSYFGDYVVEFRNIFNREFNPVWSGERTAAEAAKIARPKLEHLLKTGEET
jgi:multiple sugar transport system substrate-binding protein